MCIAILKTKDKTLTKETMKICAKNNPDGCGFSYVDNKGTLVIEKYMDFEEFWESFRHKQYQKTMLIHFRIATHGSVVVDNCHPFKLNNKMALIHNGIISGYGSKKDNVSDTRDFISKVIGNISWKMWKNPSFIKLVGDAIGSSKLAILDNKENYYIVNEDLGEWVDGVWYSNNSYKEYKVVYATKPKTTVVNKEPSPVKTSWAYVMKCTGCGKEHRTNCWYDDICEECGYPLESVGYQSYGHTYYYDEDYYKDYLYNYNCM